MRRMGRRINHLAKFIKFIVHYKCCVTVTTSSPGHNIFRRRKTTAPAAKAHTALHDACNYDPVWTWRSPH